MLRIAIVAVGCFLLLSTSGAFSDTTKVVLSTHTYCIPDTFDVLDQTTTSAVSIPKADKATGGSFQVALSAEYMNGHLPKYAIAHGDMPATMFLGVKRSSEYRISRSQSGKYHSDVLTLSGEYSGAGIEPIGAGSLTRVSSYSFPAPPIWHVLKEEPAPMAVIPDNVHEYHVAYCSRSGSSGSNCAFEIPYGEETLLKITTTENNLALKPQLIAEAHQILEAWQASCENQAQPFGAGL